MRLLSTGLGAWDTIARDTQGQHGITFPLALVHAAIVAAGYPEPECVDGGWSGDKRCDVLLISALDSRHFWRVPDFLRSWGLEPLAAARGEDAPIVVLGGQSAYNPAPVEEMVDVVFVGEAEGGVGVLLDALSASTRRQKLEHAAALPFCRVAAIQPAGHRIVATYATDIGASLRQRLQVNLRPLHRMEIARGCKGPAGAVSEKGNAACGFCALGWRAPYRENDAAAVATALRGTDVTEIHLSAGDAEGHSQIEQIRQAVDELGLRDHGWTGRMDTLRDCHVTAGKLFAIGVEGASHRLRRAVGKGRLTDDYIVERITDYWAAGGKRLMLHFIGGLPGETDEDAEDLDELLSRLCRVAGRYGRPGVDIGRQPFGPLPHTPMQWFAPGLTTDRIGGVIERWAQRPDWHLQHKSGQSYRAALAAAVTMRGGREVTRVLIDGYPRLPSTVGARAVLRRHLDQYDLDLDQYTSRWPTGSPTPWDHIETTHSRHLVTSAQRLDRMLGV